MSKVIVYIATSLDGYIARKNDDVSWLDAYLVEGEDYGYADLLRTIGTAIEGARTYEQSLKHPERMLAAILIDSTAYRTGLVRLRCVPK